MEIHSQYYTHCPSYTLKKKKHTHTAHTIRRFGDWSAARRGNVR